jgi:hypothetical protein
MDNQALRADDYLLYDVVFFDEPSFFQVASDHLVKTGVSSKYPLMSISIFVQSTRTVSAGFRFH